MAYFCTECVELVETGLNCATCKNGYCYSCSKKSFSGGVCHNCRRGAKSTATDGVYAERLLSESEYAERQAVMAEHEHEDNN